MKIFKITYSEFVPCYDIEVEAENVSKAYDKAKEIAKTRGAKIPGLTT